MSNIGSMRTGDESEDQRPHRAAHFRTGDSAPQTCESLEGVVASPLDIDEKDLESLVSARAEDVGLLVRRPKQARGRFERSFQDELEPVTVASAKARGTARLQGVGEPGEGQELSLIHISEPTRP